MEISVVLSVLGVLLALSAPSLKEWKRGIDLRSTASKVADIMLSARMRSVVERRDFSVSVDYATDVCSVDPAGRDHRRSGAPSISTRHHRPGLSVPLLAQRRLQIQRHGRRRRLRGRLPQEPERDDHGAVPGQGPGGNRQDQRREMGGGGVGRRMTSPASGPAHAAEQGFTLVEVMIALSISIIVLVANIYLINTGPQGSRPRQVDHRRDQPRHEQDRRFPGPGHGRASLFQRQHDDRQPRAGELRLHRQRLALHHRRHQPGLPRAAERELLFAAVEPETGLRPVEPGPGQRIPLPGGRRSREHPPLHGPGGREPPFLQSRR